MLLPFSILTLHSVIHSEIMPNLELVILWLKKKVKKEQNVSDK